MQREFLYVVIVLIILFIIFMKGTIKINKRKNGIKFGGHSNYEGMKYFNGEGNLITQDIFGEGIIFNGKGELKSEVEAEVLDIINNGNKMYNFRCDAVWLYYSMLLSDSTKGTYTAETLYKRSRF